MQRLVPSIGIALAVLLGGGCDDRRDFDVDDLQLPDGPPSDRLLAIFTPVDVGCSNTGVGRIPDDDARSLLRRTFGVEMIGATQIEVIGAGAEPLLAVFDVENLLLSSNGQRAAVVLVEPGSADLVANALIPVGAVEC